MPHVYNEDRYGHDMTFENVPDFSNPRTGITQPDECGGICRRTTGRKAVAVAVFSVTLHVLQVAKHGPGDAIITTVG